MPGVLKKLLEKIGIVGKEIHPDAEKLAGIVREALREMEKSADWESILSQAVVVAYKIGKGQGK